MHPRAPELAALQWRVIAHLTELAPDQPIGPSRNFPPAHQFRLRSSPDSLLEGDGFELQVPGHESSGFPTHWGRSPSPSNRRRNRCFVTGLMSIAAPRAIEGEFGVR